MKGLPYLPHVNFVITFHSDVFKSYVYGELRHYLVWGIVEKEGFQYAGILQRFRTAHRHLWSEMNDLEREYGTVNGLTVSFEDIHDSAIVIDSPKKEETKKVEEVTTKHLPGFSPKKQKPESKKPKFIRNRSIEFKVFSKSRKFRRNGEEALGIDAPIFEEPERTSERMFVLHCHRDNEDYGNFQKTLRSYNLKLEHSQDYGDFYVIPCSKLLKGWENIGRAIITRDETTEK